MRTETGQFAKGHSGNPGGRPKGPSLSCILADVLRENDPDDPSRTNAESIIRLMVSNAKQGDFKFISAIVDRIEGKPRAAADEEAEENNLPKSLNEILRAGQQAANGSRP